VEGLFGLNHRQAGKVNRSNGHGDQPNGNNQPQRPRPLPRKSKGNIWTPRQIHKETTTPKMKKEFIQQLIVDLLIDLRGRRVRPQPPPGKEN
jgi:hypothetical protein